jgi:glycosyltransferase involved in cell wall biosynthesis
MKIIAVNIAFRDELIYKRWRLLTESFEDLQITLIGPSYYEYNRFGPKIIFNPEPITEEKFKVRHLDMKKKKILLYDWWSWKYFKILKEEKPDLIYLIGYETNLVVLKTAIYRILFNQKLKIGLFTMRGTDLPPFTKSIKWYIKLLFRFKWFISKRIFDFVNVHYPKGKEIIRQQGKYNGPISLQTQVGVDKDIYYPDNEASLVIRRKYAIKCNEYVFCSAIRIEEEKGVFDIIEACRLVSLPFKFLLMGNGRQFNEVKHLIKSLGLDKNIILTGRIHTGTQVASHINASDCFVHIPKTTEKWVDTFPLAVVQGMACSKPIICSDSGALPYQVGPSGIIVKEGNVVEIANAMIKCIKNTEWAAETGNKMYNRVLESFEIRHLNRCIYQTFKAHIDGNTKDIIEDQVTAFK